MCTLFWPLVQTKIIQLFWPNQTEIDNYDYDWWEDVATICWQCNVEARFLLILNVEICFLVWNSYSVWVLYMFFTISHLILLHSAGCGSTWNFAYSFPSRSSACSNCFSSFSIIPLHPLISVFTGLHSGTTNPALLSLL